MKISIICVGKIKEKFYREAVAEYAKRLSRYCKLEVLEVEDEKTPEQPSPAQKEQILRREAVRMERYIRPDAHLTALAIGTSHIQFLIGGSLGIHPSLLDKAHDKLSFSDMTFPHQLMRVILLEQIYRGYRIMNKEPYHK